LSQRKDGDFREHCNGMNKQLHDVTDVILTMQDRKPEGIWQKACYCMQR